MRQSVIASALGTSQQSVSNAAGHLAGLVTDCGEGLVATDRARLLEHWRNEYTGPGGQAFGWYSLDPVAEQVSKAVEVAKFLDISPLVSGDIAADRIAPWKLPVRGRVYVDGPVDLADEGLVPAPSRRPRSSPASRATPLFTGWSICDPGPRSRRICRLRTRRSSTGTLSTPPTRTAVKLRPASPLS